MNTQTPTLQVFLRNAEEHPWRVRAVVQFDRQRSAPFYFGDIGTSVEYGEVRWYAENSLMLREGGNVVRAQAAEAILTGWSVKLRETLCQAEAANSWLTRVSSDRQGVLELVSDVDTECAALRLPWELMNVEADRTSPLHTCGVSVVRRAYSNPANDAVVVAGPLRVLVVVSRPESTPFLNARWSGLSILEAGTKRGSRINFVRPATFSALLRCLETARAEGAPVHILHFDGHGTTLPSARNMGALCFETDEGKLDLVPAEQFSAKLSEFGLALVVLEACNTADDASGQDSLALSLLRSGVPAVVAMGYAAHFEMTKSLIATFYQQVIDGIPVAEALTRARLTVYQASSRSRSLSVDAPLLALSDWFVPQLYQRTSVVSFTPTQGSRPEIADLPATESGLSAGFPAQFEGRAYELHFLERVVTHHQVTALQGIAGVGKSALAKEAVSWWRRTRLFDQIIWVALDQCATRDSIARAMGKVLTGSGNETLTDQEILRLCGEAGGIIVWDGLRPAPPAASGLADLEHGRIDSLARNLTKGPWRILVTTRDPRAISAAVVSMDHLTEDDAIRLVLSRSVGSATVRYHDDTQGPEIVDEMRAMVRLADYHPATLEFLAAGADLAEAFAASSIPECIADLSLPTKSALPALGLMTGGGLEWTGAHTTGLAPAAWQAVREEAECSGIIRVNNEILRPHPLLRVGVPAPDAATIHNFLEGVFSLANDYLEAARSETSPELNFAMRRSEPVIRRAIDLAVETGNFAGAIVIAHPFRVFLEREGRRVEAASLLVSLFHAAGPAADPSTVDGAMILQEGAYGIGASDPNRAVQILTHLLDVLAGVSWDAQSTCDQVRTLLSEMRERALRVAGSSGAVGSDQSPADSTRRAEELLHAGLLREAAKEALAGIEAARRSQNWSSLARKLALYGTIQTQQRQWLAAEATFEEACMYAARVADIEAAATAQLGWANLHLACHRIQEAISKGEDALQRFQVAGDDRGQVVTLNALGNAELERLEFARALAWFDQAIAKSTIMGNLDLIALSRGNRAVSLTRRAERSTREEERQESLEDAQVESEAVLTLWQQVESTVHIGLAYSNLANILRLMGKLDEAELQGRRSVDLLEPLGHPYTSNVLQVLEAIAKAKGRARSVAQWQSRRAVAEAIQRGEELPARIPLDLAERLIGFALDFRGNQAQMRLALLLSGIDLDEIFAVEPGFARNLLALSEPTASRPQVIVSSSYRSLIDAAWTKRMIQEVRP